MLTREPTPEMFKEWEKTWREYKNFLKPNRKTGQDLLNYLSQRYVLTEIHDKEAADAVRFNITMNKPLAEKLPNGATPSPRIFFLKTWETVRPSIKMKTKIQKNFGVEIQQEFLLE